MPFSKQVSVCVFPGIPENKEMSLVHHRNSYTLVRWASWRFRVLLLGACLQQPSACGRAPQSLDSCQTMIDGPSLDGAEDNAGKRTCHRVFPFASQASATPVTNRCRR